MLTKLTVRNFKRFDEIEVELGSPVVFIGPNNSGKTSALQAIALWEVGVKRWSEKRGGKKAPEKRPGVTINRRELVAVPVPDTNLLWRNLRVRHGQRVDGKSETSNVFIDIVVEGVTEGRTWECGVEFYYANPESLYCRPLRQSDARNTTRMPIPEEAVKVQLAFLPPMSGLAAYERRLDPGAINVLIGEGRTAEVLRNLCWKIHSEANDQWRELKKHIVSLFHAELDDPLYVSERGEILMSYRERKTRLDLSSSGRGLQQTLLLLAYMYANPGAVLLLDEPDAHLEILRQRQIYELLTDVARTQESQIIAASHSEVLLNEAAARDVVIAFLGKPHRINDRGAQVLKSLKEIGFEDFYQAEQTGWVLYLEGSTDLAILRAFAETLGYKDAQDALQRPFVRYVGNQPGDVSKHLHGLREAVPYLQGVAIFDRLDRQLRQELRAVGHMWKKREIENYICMPEVLEAYAEGTVEQGFGPLFTGPIVEKRKQVMKECIRELEEALEKLQKPSPWDDDTKVSDEFLTPLFKTYFKKLDLPNLMAKKDFYVLARLVPKKMISEEVKEKLQAIVNVYKKAKPAGPTE